MKALTICQPYASMILDLIPGEGPKPVENRTWATSYRGPLLIHAGKSMRWFDDPDRDRVLPRGVILGVVNMIACLTLRDYESLHRPHPHANGPYCWVFDKLFQFADPLPWTGRQGLFDVPDEIVKPLIDEAYELTVAEKIRQAMLADRETE